VADPNNPNLLSNRFASTKPCENELGILKLIKIPNLHQSLEGEGSHRRLISKLKVEVDSDFSSTFLDRFHCELVIIESLSGVFADPFELQRLVKRKVYLDAAVFGDANVELPSALSNSSFVEIHMDLVPSSKDNHELVIELPLHVRYPPLNGSGYSKVEISQADLYTRCRKKDRQNLSVEGHRPGSGTGSNSEVAYTMRRRSSQYCCINCHLPFSSGLCFVNSFHFYFLSSHDLYYRSLI
jgi:hypothetical protein